MARRFRFYLLFFIWIPAFSKLLNRGHARPGYGTDPFSGVEMPLHEDVPDGLIDVAESKHQKEGRVEIEVGEIHEGKHHEVHKRDLEDGTESRVARRNGKCHSGPSFPYG